MFKDVLLASRQLLSDSERRICSTQSNNDGRLRDYFIGQVQSLNTLKQSNFVWLQQSQGNNKVCPFKDLSAKWEGHYISPPQDHISQEFPRQNLLKINLRLYLRFDS